MVIIKTKGLYYLLLMFLRKIVRSRKLILFLQNNLSHQVNKTYINYQHKYVKAIHYAFTSEQFLDTIVHFAL